MRLLKLLASGLILVFLLNLLGHAESLDDSIKGYIQSINKDENNQERALAKLRTEIRTILFNANDGAEKKRLQSEISSKLEPINPLLVRAASSESERLKSLSVDLTRHTNVNEQVVDVLRKIVLERKFDSGQGYIIGNAFWVLYEKGFIDADIESAMVNRLAESLNDGSGRFGDLAFLTGHAKIESAIPILIKGLVSSEDYIMLASAKSLKQYGALAREALPTLQDVLQKKSGLRNENYREIEALEFAISAITNPRLTDGSREDRRPSSEYFNEHPISTNAKMPVQPPCLTESKSTPWRWIIGTILLLAVAGGILLKFRRK